jgi:membrane protein YqaA with SNARE-associated domain
VADLPSPTPRPRASDSDALLLFWGFAEATLFFIVPDVGLTYAAIGSVRVALRRMLGATLGALIGAAIMYAWAAVAFDSARDAVALVPAISDRMIDAARDDLSALGPWSMLPGAFRGVPIKIYAIHAGDLGTPLWLFLAALALARLARFGAAIVLAWALRRTLARKLSDAHARRVLIAFWILFYAAFLALMPW